MNIRALNRVLDSWHDLLPAEKIAMIGLAEFAEPYPGKRFQAAVSYTQLVEFTGLSTRHVSAVLPALERKGVLERIPAKTERGANTWIYVF